VVYPLHRAEPVPASPNLPAIEEDVLAYWAKDDTFRASVAKNPAGEKGKNEFIFYDGPPFANGLPHYGHLLTGYAKDVIPRYQTMRGRRVERRFGWDTHGLPAELEAMRQLGIKTKEEILELGVDKFNEVCRESVMKYTKEWQDYVTRQARWVDFAGDYKTMNLPYMESVIWGFKQLWDKGLVYEGFRVLPYCWNDQTPLSNHELRMDDEVYQDRTDPAVTVGFRATSGSANGQVQPGDLLLIWTTTPWTLPANLLIAAGPAVEYVIVQSAKPTGKTERYVLAKDLLSKYAKELLDNAEQPIESQIVGQLTGSELAGVTYQPPFSYFTDQPNAFRVVTADYVTTTDGTGLVHTAPAFGEDDKLTSDANGVEAVMPVGPDGCFQFPVTDYQGQQVFEANAQVLEHLKNRVFLDSGIAAQKGIAESEVAVGSVTPGTVLVKREQYTHSYPHCYRCKKPLIYMGVSSWFVAVTKIKDRMLELGDQITWTPEYIRDGIFGKWIANARDWSITRNRFWGTPVPVWKSDNPEYPRIDAYGSLAELEKDFGVKVTDLHRPYIDELTRPNPDDPTGQSTMRRVADIMDVWVDSGSMPYAQVHYPFENQEWFEDHYPGDFIVEYIGQTRGWFYVLHVLATALFDRPAFRTAISHGIVLGSDGTKMSKSLRNYPDVSEVLDRDGADAMRWFLMSSPILRGGNLIVTEQGIRDSVRQVLLPLWSTYYFFTLYANSCARLGGGAGYQAKAIDPARVAELPALDRYILAKTDELVDTVTTQLDAYDIPGACESVRAFLDVLTNWYVRTQRDRFWAEDANAFDTLYTVLETLTRVMAPLAPLEAEEVWRGLTGGRSVHLTDWPTADSGGGFDGRPDGLDTALYAYSTDGTAQPTTGTVGRVAASGRLSSDAVAAVETTTTASPFANPALVAAMDEVREVVTTALSLRKANQIRVRQPLSTLTVAVANPDDLTEYVDLLQGELNVKQVNLIADTPEAFAKFGITENLQVNARAAGPRLGKQVQSVIKAAKSGNWKLDNGTVVVVTPEGAVELEPSEYSLETVVNPAASNSEFGDLAAAVLPSGGFAVFNLTMTDDLLAEGYARNAIREIQETRKKAGLDVADRIALTIYVPESRTDDLDKHRILIQKETLATTLSLVPVDDDKPLAIKLEKDDDPIEFGGHRFDNAD